MPKSKRDSTRIPIKVFTLGELRFSIWRDEVKEDYFRYSCILSKQYTKDGQTETTHTLGESDVILAAALTQKAAEWIMRNPANVED